MAEKKAAAPAAEEPKGSSNKLKLIILILAALLLLGGGGGAAYYFLVMKGQDQGEEHAADGHGGSAEKNSGHAEEGHGDEGAEGDAAHPALVYHPLEPATVNIPPPSPVRFLRINISIATKDPAVIAAIDKHMPVIRNDLLARLSSQKFAVINTPAGKNALREELKTMITGILIKASEPSKIEDVLFTDLVMQ